MGKIFYIMGKSASGKDRIYSLLVENKELNLKKLILYTTRPIRAGEEEGVQYYFTDDSRVDHGQTEAARSLGFRQSQTMTMVVLPQAVKNILPALGNEFVTVIKESSIVSVIGIADLMFRSKDVIAVTYISLETLAIAAILYFIMTFISGRFVSLMERKMSNGTK